MAWADGLNATINAGATTVPDQDYNNGLLTRGTEPFNIPTDRYYAGENETAAQIARPTRAYRCSRDQHYFDCKHERRCQCGLTERLP